MKQTYHSGLRSKLSLFAMVLLVVLLMGGGNTAFATQLEFSNAAPGNAVANSNAELSAPVGQNLTLTGTLSVVHVDPAPGSGLEYYNYVTFYADDGNSYILNIPYGQVMQYTRQQVTVIGRTAMTFNPQFVDHYDATINVDMVLPTGNANARGFLEPTTGSFKYINVLCRFSDSTGDAPKTPDYFNTLFSATNPGLGDFFTNITYGQVTLTADTVTTWYTLPNTKDSYLFTTEGGGTDARQNDIRDDCIAAADADVNFADYEGINLMLDVDYVSYAQGTPGDELNLDGANRLWRVTWNPPLSFEKQYFIGHEIGHSLALPHSAGTRNPEGGDNWPYDNFWDLMSGGGDNGKITDPTVGGLGPGTNAYYSLRVGWLAASRVVTVADKTRTTVTLERLLDPESTTNPQLILVPVNDSTNEFYAVELRQEVGYDRAIPREAVIIYRVILDRSEDGLARIVDADDGNVDDNDEGASWTVGETYTDTTNNISIQIVSNNGSNYTVAVNNDAAADATDVPTVTATASPTATATAEPTDAPTEAPTDEPTETPTDPETTEEPTDEPTEAPTDAPTTPTPITRLYPTDGQTISTAADYRPRFQWQAVEGAQWYHVYVATSDYSSVIYNKWFQASSACSESTCSIDEDVWINTTGSFIFWMTWWSPAVEDTYLDGYTSTPFTISMGAPAAVTGASPSGDTSETSINVQFTENPDTLWYQIWVGLADYSNLDGNLFNWFRADDICNTEGACSVAVPGTLTPGAYEIWIQQWGPGGYPDWYKASTFNVVP